MEVAGEIKSRIPDAVVFKNKIPKMYIDYDIYFNLIHNEDGNESCYE
jgi:hypothetical protein